MACVFILNINPFNHFFCWKIEELNGYYRPACSCLFSWKTNRRIFFNYSLQMNMTDFHLILIQEFNIKTVRCILSHGHGQYSSKQKILSMCVSKDVGKRSLRELCGNRKSERTFYVRLQRYCEEKSKRTNFLFVWATSFYEPLYVFY